MFERRLSIGQDESFFLWGPRQAGKTTLLRQLFPRALVIDLLKSDEFARYTRDPGLLRTEMAAGTDFVIVDEIQKVPTLLDEIHWLIENRGTRFGLCGSSARKLRRGHANLLGGRAVRYELHGLVAAEVGPAFDLVRMLNHGTLPRYYLSENPNRLIRSYVSDYLREEVAAEGLVRNLQTFAHFLDAAALSDTEMVNASNIARDCGVSAHTVQSYFEILVDTLLGRWLPVFRRRPKRRVAGAPKFYFEDVGVVNQLAKRGQLLPGSELFGKAFENWVFHELLSYSHYSDKHFDLSYWRLASGVEVDFIVDDMRVAIEAKATPLVHGSHMRGLRSIIDDHPTLQCRLVVSLDLRPRRTEDGIDILPAQTFVERLWAGDLL
jgi:predicted AAA+ superfamily ATPase